MRDIRFRGKQKSNGKWIYGLLIRKMKKYRALDYCTLGKRIESVFYIQTLETINNVDTLEKYKIDPETVGQYTGLKDKNGKEIYEGDILLSEMNNNPPRKCIVGFSEVDARFSLTENNEGKDRFFPFDFSGTTGGVWCGYRQEIIGNIHE